MKFREIKRKILKFLGIRKKVRTPWLPTEQKVEELYLLLQKNEAGLSCENWEDLRNVARREHEANAFCEGDVFVINGVEWRVAESNKSADSSV